MLNVLLVRIQPIDHQILEDFKSFSDNKEALSFNISVDEQHKDRRVVHKQSLKKKR